MEINNDQQAFLDSFMDNLSATMPKASVLIVDDEKNILSSLSRALRIEDYEVMWRAVRR